MRPVSCLVLLRHSPHVSLSKISLPKNSDNQTHQRPKNAWLSKFPTGLSDEIVSHLALPGGFHTHSQEFSCLNGIDLD